jgi:putative spermidine/putrescine transport system ATP-binding protein
MAGVELQGLHRRFGEIVALAGIDLYVPSGEFLSLLGPSGCGKTTALRLVAGFDRPTSGRVVIDGKDVAGVPPNRRDIGMVFQAYSLFPNMTAERNVEFGLRVRKQGRAARRRRALELLELVGLGHAAGRYPHQLSGGMQQRVALARALAIEPRLLLLDEPLSALDANVRVQLRDEIRRIQTRLGITAIYVTHDQEEALSISDRVAVLSDGRIEQIGSPAEIYGAPATRVVAEVVGTMNRLIASVVGNGIVDYGGQRLAVDAARGLPTGERILCLVRPETVDISPTGAGPVPEGAIGGEVVSHTYLGPVTRVRMVDSTGEHGLTADVGKTHAAALTVGTSVAASFPPDSARVLSLVGSDRPTDSDPLLRKSQSAKWNRLTSRGRRGH